MRKSLLLTLFLYACGPKVPPVVPDPRATTAPRPEELTYRYSAPDNRTTVLTPALEVATDARLYVGASYEGTALTESPVLLGLVFTTTRAVGNHVLMYNSSGFYLSTDTLVEDSEGIQMHVAPVPAYSVVRLVAGNGGIGGVLGSGDQIVLLSLSSQDLLTLRHFVTIMRLEDRVE